MGVGGPLITLIGFMISDLKKAPGSHVPRDIDVATLAYFVVAGVVLGALAFVASLNLELEPPNKDIWQHAASVRALLVDLDNPSNPFVLSDESSRHYHPLWVVGAAVAGPLGLDEWDILRTASYLSMFILGLGIFVFSKAYFASRWAPIFLLIVLLFGWSMQPEHTGHHSFQTLLYAAPYPATFLIGFSLILWGLTIRALADHRYAVLVLALAALMFATHQLGAVIGLIGAGSFVLLWPKVSLRSRIIVSLAVIAGLFVSLLWPYHNPLTLVLSSGNADWEGGPRFYGFAHLFAAFVPAFVGLLHFREAKARPLVLTFVIFGAVFLFGLTGFKLSGRLLAPTAFVLHIGLTGVVLKVCTDYFNAPTRRRFIPGLTIVFALVLFVFPTSEAIRDELRYRKTALNVYSIGQQLTADMPKTEPIAVAPQAVWPIVASGQRVVSIPWPEPGIRDLAQRQQANASLFDPALSRADRLAVAQRYGANTLIVDTRFLPSNVVETLRDQAVYVEQIASIVRFDLSNR